MEHYLAATNNKLDEKEEENFCKPEAEAAELHDVAADFAHLLENKWVKFEVCIAAFREVSGKHACRLVYTNL